MKITDKKKKKGKDTDLNELNILKKPQTNPSTNKPEFIQKISTISVTTLQPTPLATQAFQVSEN